MSFAVSSPSLRGVPFGEPLEIRVYDRQQLVFSGEFSGPIELGRQRDSEERAPSNRLENGKWRVVIARYDENTVSREHALIEPLEDGRIRVANLSQKLPIRVNTPKAIELASLDEARKNPGLSVSCEVTIPAILALGQKTIRVQQVEPSIEEQLRPLAEATRRPGEISSSASGLLTLALPSTSQHEAMRLVKWLKDTMDVLQNAASSSDFFLKAAQDVVDRVGLDTGIVLLRGENEWEQRALHTSPHVRLEPNWLPSRQVLSKVQAEKRTFFQAPGGSFDGRSLAGIKWVVAAPILDRQGNVIGALYGDRRPGIRPASIHPITELDAMLVELLAGGVAAGIARVEQEKRAVEAQVKFAQFFTPELAAQLAETPNLLEGRDSEVTILFGDIRGFSSISEQLGPARTVEWINDVMGALSDCVLDHHGVLVDYIGDEIMAMWGAPYEQPDHAKLACEAALQMLETIERMNEQWSANLGEPMGLGIGINTGLARVGNTGSRRKFKYGPLGNTVNLASRVQGATKYLKSKVLITGDTRNQLDDTFRCRRLCTASVVNIAKPVELYELAFAGEDDSWETKRRHYEEALRHFEEQRFTEAARILSEITNQDKDDWPSLVLLNRVVTWLVEPRDPFDHVWKLPGK